MFLNPYSKRYARYLALYRNGSRYIETGFATVNHLMGAGPFLQHFPVFALLTISLGAPPGPLENASIAGLTFTTNLVCCQAIELRGVNLFPTEISYYLFIVVALIRLSATTLL